MNELLTVNEVAALLRLSKRQVYELVKDEGNPIPAVRIRSSLRFRKCAIDTWIESMEKTA